MFCPGCGTQSQDGDKYCGKCGTVLPDDQFQYRDDFRSEGDMTAGNSVTTMSQIQCPNCGGFRVSSLNKETVLSGTYKPISQKGRRNSILLMVLFTFLLLCGCPLSVASSDPNALLILMGIALVVLIPLWILALRSLKRGSPEVVGIINSLECDLCGYKWTEGPGQQKPTIQVRPDLIAKGEQRLREAEARRRRDAEAYQAWQNQQNQK